MADIRILIVDDHTLFRQGLRQIFELSEGFQVVGEAEDGEQAVEKASQLEPDVILMDINMPGLDGVQATCHILEERPAARVIILTMYRQDNHVFDAIKAGARGYLLKDAEWMELLQAVQAVHSGEALINPTLAARLLEEFRRLNRPAAPARENERLKEGELELLKLVAQGLENKDIAGQFYLSEKTVANRLSEIYRKLQVNNRTQAALYALRQRLTTLD